MQALLILATLAGTTPGVDTAIEIIQFAERTGQSRRELLAIAYTESRWNNQAVSPTGDYGAFQINCRIWYKTFGYDSVRECAQDMLRDVGVGAAAASYIMNHYRAKFPHCRKHVFACYNGGPRGWQRHAKVRHYHRVVSQRKLDMPRLLWYKSKREDDSRAKRQRRIGG